MLRARCSSLTNKGLSFASVVFLSFCKIISNLVLVMKKSFKKLCESDSLISYIAAPEERNYSHIRCKLRQCSSGAAICNMYLPIVINNFHFEAHVKTYHNVIEIIGIVQNGHLIPAVVYKIFHAGEGTLR